MGRLTRRVEWLRFRRSSRAPQIRWKYPRVPDRLNVKRPLAFPRPENQSDGTFTESAYHDRANSQGRRVPRVPQPRFTLVRPSRIRHFEKDVRVAVDLLPFRIIQRAPAGEVLTSQGLQEVGVLL